MVLAVLLLVVVASEYMRTRGLDYVTEHVVGVSAICELFGVLTMLRVISRLHKAKGEPVPNQASKLLVIFLGLGGIWWTVQEAISQYDPGALVMLSISTVVLACGNGILGFRRDLLAQASEP